MLVGVYTGMLSSISFTFRLNQEKLFPNMVKNRKMGICCNSAHEHTRDSFYSLKDAQYASLY